MRTRTFCDILSAKIIETFNTFLYEKTQVRKSNTQNQCLLWETSAYLELVQVTQSMDK